MVEMTDRHGRKLKNFADWSAISREVKRNINEGCSSFKIRVGGFSVTFSESKGARHESETDSRTRGQAI